MNTQIDTSETAARLARGVGALPPLPVTAQRILTCFGDEFIDAEKVTDVIEQDPGICAKLLGLANSAYFGLAEGVNRIDEAIARVLGVDTVRSLVLAMAIQQSFNSRNCPGFDTERFWMLSLRAAECCKRIAAEDGEADDMVRDLAYSAGLCHNLGLMAFAHLDPSRTSAVLAEHRKQALPDTLSDMLMAEFETDHKMMTARLATIWSLPPAMVNAYEFRISAEAGCDDRLGYILAAGVAAAENADVAEEERTSLDEWARQLGIDPQTMAEIASVSERQEERIESLANNMVR